MQHSYIAPARRGYKHDWNHGCTQINTDENRIERNERELPKNADENDAVRN
jgi:hypothetical protein